MVLPVLGLALAVALLAAACGGGGEGVPVLSPSGQLTDPRTVPTATPWAEPPQVIYLEPGMITAVGASQGEPGGTTPSGECGDTYTVQAGDYPLLIAEKCGVSLEALMEANPGLEPTKLQVGQVLNIPR